MSRSRNRHDCWWYCTASKGEDVLKGAVDASNWVIDGSVTLAATSLVMGIGHLLGDPTAGLGSGFLTGSTVFGELAKNLWGKGESGYNAGNTVLGWRNKAMDWVVDNQKGIFKWGGRVFTIVGVILLFIPYGQIPGAVFTAIGAVWMTLDWIING